LDHETTPAQPLLAHWLDSPQPREGGLPEALEAFHIETPKSKANKSLYLYIIAPPIDPFLFQVLIWIWIVNHHTLVIPSIAQRPPPLIAQNRRLPWRRGVRT